LPEIAPHLLAMDLTNELPYLLRRAHFEAEARFAEIFGAMRVTSRQAALLLTIMQRPGISQAKLTDLLGLDPNTLSSIVSRVLRRRLIKRERSPSDRRSYGLRITPDGLRLLGCILPGVGTYQQRVTSRLTAVERRQLVVLLQRLLRLEE
jgi:DNA-binding MarR family transcriptional regulator